MKRFIEVSFPAREVSEESAREKNNDMFSNHKIQAAPFNPAAISTILLRSIPHTILIVSRNCRAYGII